MSRRIELEIEELTLDGVPVSERYRFADAFEAELDRLLREDGVSSDGPGPKWERPPAIFAARTVYEEVMRCMREASADPERP